MICYKIRNGSLASLNLNDIKEKEMFICTNNNDFSLYIKVTIPTEDLNNHLSTMLRTTSDNVVTDGIIYEIPIGDITKKMVYYINNLARFKKDNYLYYFDDQNNYMYDSWIYSTYKTEIINLLNETLVFFKEKLSLQSNSLVTSNDYSELENFSNFSSSAGINVAGKVMELFRIIQTILNRADFSMNPYAQQKLKIPLGG